MSEWPASRWVVEDRLDLLLDDVHEAHIHIVGGDVAVKAGDCPCSLEVERLEGEPLVVAMADGVVEVRYEHPIRRHGWEQDRALVGLTVPPRTDVVVVTASADVVVSGLMAEASIRSASGSVVLDRIGGRAHVRTASGDVEARDLTASLRCQTVSGDLTVAHGATPSISAHTVSGSELLDLEPQEGGEYELATVSGGVALRLGEDPRTRVDIRSLSGRIDSAFDLASHRGERGPVGRRVVGDIGDAHADLVVRTVSGDVSLLRPAAVAR